MKLSINLNKVALLRNSRGSDYPSLEKYAHMAISLGVDGLTLHPRPDHRHATSQDALAVSKICKDSNVEFNLEGNPFTEPSNNFFGFSELCKKTMPHQVTLVPDKQGQLTSDAGWPTDYKENKLSKFLSQIKEMGLRTSLFIDATVEAVEFAATTGVDRVEIYTGPFAKACAADSADLPKMLEVFTHVISRARELNLGVNAGHDLDIFNLSILQKCGKIDEVSIGHAIIAESLQDGFANTITNYLNATKESQSNVS